MSKYFNVPFANGGDKTTIPDGSQPSGDVSFTEGYTPDYEKDQATDPDAKDVPRQGENYLNFVITEAIKEFQERGGKAYDPIVNYPVNGIILGSDNNFYICRIKNGPDASFLPVVGPVGDTTGTWEPYAATYNSIANLKSSSLNPFDGQVVKVLGYYVKSENQDWDFQWTVGDLSTEVAADPQSGIYVALDSDPTGATGAFVRLISNSVLDILFFGAKSGSNSTVAIESTLDAGVLSGKYAMLIPYGNFLISSIDKTAATDSAVNIYGLGKGSILTVTNITGLSGLKLTTGGNGREINVNNFKLIGNSQCGHGLHIVNAGSPSVFGQIYTDNFENPLYYGQFYDTCQSVVIESPHTFESYNGIALKGISHATRISHPVIEYYTGKGIALIERDIGDSPQQVVIDQPVFYGPSTTAGTHIYGEGIFGLSVLNPYFERALYAMDFIDAPISLTENYHIKVTNPKRGGGSADAKLRFSTLRRSVLEQGSLSECIVTTTSRDNLYLLSSDYTYLTGVIHYSDSVIAPRQSSGRTFQGVIAGSGTETFTIPSGGVESSGSITVGGDVGRAFVLYNKTAAGTLSITTVSDTSAIISVVSNNITMTNPGGSADTFEITFNSARSQEVVTP